MFDLHADVGTIAASCTWFQKSRWEKISWLGMVAMNVRPVHTRTRACEKAEGAYASSCLVDAPGYDASQSHGGVLGPNDKIYLVPRNADHVGGVVLGN